MKKLLLFGCVALLAVGCTQNETKTDASTDSKMSDSTSTEKIEYAYTTESGGNWEPGSRQNAANVLKALKAYENNNIAESMTYFADSVELNFDRFHAKLTRDSVAKFFTEGRNKLQSQVIKMEDWESVISKDGTREYVSLWYKEINTDKNGKVDSVFVMDDVRIKNGKIASIDQKIRHFPDSKKM